MTIIDSIRMVDMFRIEIKDSVAFKEVYEMGIKEGIERGIREGMEKGMKRGIKEGMERGIREGIEKGIKEGIERGIREGEYRRAIEDARRMYELGADIDFIKRVVGILSEEELRRVLEGR